MSKFENFGDRDAVESRINSRLKRVSRVSRASAAIIFGSSFYAFKGLDATPLLPAIPAAVAPIAVRHRAFGQIDEAIHKYAKANDTSIYEKYTRKSIKIVDGEPEVSTTPDTRTRLTVIGTTSDVVSRHFMPLGTLHNGALITGATVCADYYDGIVEGANTAAIYAIGIGGMAAGAFLDAANLRMPGYRAQLDNIDGIANVAGAQQVAPTA